MNKHVSGIAGEQTLSDALRRSAELAELIEQKQAEIEARIAKQFALLKAMGIETPED